MQLVGFFLYLPLSLMENTPIFSSLYLTEHVSPSNAPGNRIYGQERSHKNLLDEPRSQLKSITQNLILCYNRYSILHPIIIRKDNHA